MGHSTPKLSFTTLKVSLLFSALFSISAPSLASSTPSLKTQIGQMLMVGFDGISINSHSPIVEEMPKYGYGGVILFDHQDGKTRNIASPSQLRTLTHDLQQQAKQNQLPPLFIATDQEGGLISNLKAKKGFRFFSNFSEQQLGTTNFPPLTKYQAYTQGKLLKTSGINLDFAPVVDLNINPNNPAIGKLQRSFGKEVPRVVTMAQAAITGYHHAGIMCTLKHFPGLGSASSNTDFNSVDVTKTWSKKELIPYKDLLSTPHPCQFVMVTHLVNRKLDNTGQLASLSYPIVTGLLREQLHFKGLIITDNMDAKAITNKYEIKTAIQKAVLAGNNIILIGGAQGHSPYADAKIAFNAIYELAKSSPTARKQIEESYQKIMAVKQAYFESKTID
ncbi:hypothetical protein M9194_00860 [Vibrio sp. S4M6]|uniref:glycoside hydrolase family 3 N-terminal domain-containing protein n=1 Tax=Vibrio sinus TaxID=2946865 RepID=UPI00202A169E|nr:glycoside hydrolase family 3 N-terminal domain-containing protein [Vibrio sinus]MCL9779978.1 hypothetical protein [Vibrio sinus]